MCRFGSQLAAIRRALSVFIIVLMLGVIGAGFAVTPVAGQATPPPGAAGTAVSQASLEIVGLVESPGLVTLAELQQLPQETIEATYAAGGTPTAHTYTGVRLTNVLDAVGMPGAPQTHNPLLRRYFIVTASDGYQIVLSGGELDPNFGNTPAYLVWEEDGAPLSAEDGPLRLVVPGDLRGGRFVRGVVRIEVRDITEPGA